MKTKSFASTLAFVRRLRSAPRASSRALTLEGTMFRKGWLFLTLALSACVVQPTAGPQTTYSQEALSESDLEELELFTIDLINGYRSRVGAAPVVADDVLHDFARKAVEERARTRQAHTYFESQYKACGCGLLSENQGDITRQNTPEPRAEIKTLLEAMWKEGPGGGHYEVMISEKAKRVGIGFFVDKGIFFMSNDFGK